MGKSGVHLAGNDVEGVGVYTPTVTNAPVEAIWQRRWIQLVSERGERGESSHAMSIIQTQFHDALHVLGYCAPPGTTGRVTEQDLHSRSWIWIQNRHHKPYIS